MSSTAYKRSSLFSNNSSFSSSSSGLYLALVVVLAAYPQSASAAPNDRFPRDVRQSGKARANPANLVDQLDAQPAVMERTSRVRRRDINRRGAPSLQDLIDEWNRLAGGGNGGFGNFGGNNNNNNNNNNNHYSPSPIPINTPNPVPSPSSSHTTTTTHVQTSAQQQQQQPAPTSPLQTGTSTSHSISISQDASDTTMTNGQMQTSMLPSGGGPSPNGPGNTTPEQSPTGSHGQPQTWSGASYHDPGENSTASIGPNSTNASGQSRVNNGLVAGLVVTLVILLAFCALAAFLVVRRMRKKRREREESSPFNDTAPWLQEKKEQHPGIAERKGQYSEIAETERTKARDEPPESRLSRMQSISSEPRMRARTPGGSSAIPVPYNPSEVSDDISAHFTFFPQDDAIGVPVPYPLALHVPARVAQAMVDRDVRWLEYEELRRQQKHAHSSMASTRTPSDIVTIPDRPNLSRRTTQQSTTDSVMSDDTNLGVHYAQQLEYDPSRSEVGVYGSQHAQEGRESLLSVADFPIPPPPASIRPQSWRIRRASAAPSQLRSVSENPFATDVNLESSGSTIGSGRLSDEMTATQHGDSHQIPISTTVGTTTEGGQGASLVAMRQSDDPFDDNAHPMERRLTSRSLTTEPSSIQDSDAYAGVVEHQTVDGHDSLVFAFPAPPMPVRRPS